MVNVYAKGAKKVFGWGGHAHLNSLRRKCLESYLDQREEIWGLTDF